MTRANRFLTRARRAAFGLHWGLRLGSSAAAACLLACCALAPARAGGSKDKGSSAAAFLKIGPGARPGAMGEAFSAVADDAHAVYYNPAGLDGARGWELTGMHDRYFDGIDYNFVAAAVPIRRLTSLAEPKDIRLPVPEGAPRSAPGATEAPAGAAPARDWSARPRDRSGTLALAIYSLSASDVERRGLTDTDSPDGTFEASDSALALAYGRPVTDRVLAGAGLKLVRQSLDGRSGSAFALDLGGLYRRDSKWSAGAGIRNLGPGLKLGGVRDPLPLSGHLGAAHRPRPELTLAADLALPRDANPGIGLGAEYSRTFQDKLRGSFRLGWQTRANEADGFGGLSLGAGAGYGRLDVDFAWVPMGDLGNTFRYSLKLGF